jgi:CRP/FNR family transcriptional regulator, anaerobic regulatory protein
MMDSFLHYINSIAPLSGEAQAALLAKTTRRTFPKNQLLVANLAVCDKLYFVEKGLLRVYYQQADRDVTDFFAAENSVVGPILRFRPIRTLTHCVDLLEETTVVYVNLLDLEMLYQQHHDLERLGRLIALQAIFQLQYRIDSLQFLSAQERYDDFLRTYPAIVQRVSLQHIASYLGMNQVTLSRVRSKKAE